MLRFIRKLLIKISLLKFRYPIFLFYTFFPPKKIQIIQTSLIPSNKNYSKIKCIKFFHSLIIHFFFPIDHSSIPVDTNYPHSSFSTRIPTNRRSSMNRLLLLPPPWHPPPYPSNERDHSPRASINRCKNWFVLVTRLKKRLEGGRKER